MTKNQPFSMQQFLHKQELLSLRIDDYSIKIEDNPIHAFF